MKTKVDWEVQFRAPGRNQNWWCAFYRQIRPDAEDMRRFREHRRAQGGSSREQIRVVKVTTTELRQVVAVSR